MKNSLIGVRLREWTAFIARRLVYLLGVLLVVSGLTFALTRMIGNPASMIAGLRATPETIARIERELGLDQPWPLQFLDYLSGLLQGDFGVSRLTYRPVMEEFLARFPASLELAVVAMAIGLLWAVPFGIAAGMRKGGFIDRVLGPLSAQIGLSMPSFWLGLVLLFIFTHSLGWTPSPAGRLDPFMNSPPDVTGFFVLDSALAGQWETFRASVLHLALPAITLAIGFSPPIFQVTRDSTLSAIGGDFVRTYRSLGLPESLIFTRLLKHVLPQAMTLSAFTFGYLIGGAVLVEVVFSWPGVGLYSVNALNQVDSQPIVGLVILSAVMFVILFFVTDLLHAYWDPRVRRR